MTPIGLRVEDDLARAIGGLARAAGMSQSAWIRRALIDALQQRPDEIRDLPDFTCPSKMVSIRFPADEVAAMETVAQQAGLTRAQWIKRTIRWQLWDRAGELRLTPASAQSILKLAVQVRAIGRSLNQVVKAVNAANRPGSSLEISFAARGVIEMESRLSETIDTAISELASIAAGEVRYWTGNVGVSSKKRRNRA